MDKTIKPEKTINPDKYYYAKEAAELVPYSYKTFLKWIKTRKIKASRGFHVEADGKRVGHRKFLIKGQAIIDFIDDGELDASSFGLGSFDFDTLDPQALDPAAEYVELTDTDLERLPISGKVLLRIFG